MRSDDVHSAWLATHLVTLGERIGGAHRTQVQGNAPDRQPGFGRAHDDDYSVPQSAVAMAKHSLTKILSMTGLEVDMYAHHDRSASYLLSMVFAS